MKNINEITKSEALEIKYILTDIDGTLTGPDGRISPKVYEMLWKLREAGYILIPVTENIIGEPLNMKRRKQLTVKIISGILTWPEEI